MAGISFRDVHGIADELGVDVQTVRRWIQSGKLRAFKPGKEYRVRQADLEEFLAAREVRPKAPTSSQPSFNGLLEEERRAAYQRSWRDFITRLAERIDAEADSKGYEPAWILEIDKIRRDTAQILLDNGILGNPEAFSTKAEYRQSWEIDDALTELEHAVERAWRAQMRISEQMEQRREADQLRELREKREADKDSKEARELEAIRKERRGSA